MSSPPFAWRFLTGLGLGAALASGLALVGAPWPLPLDAGLVAHVSGLLAGYLTAVMLVLMSRAPLLERRVPLGITGDNLRRLVPDVADRDVYLCASPGLAVAVRTALHDAGLPRRQLHEEVFAF